MCAIQCWFATGGVLLRFGAAVLGGAHSVRQRSEDNF